jgi:S-adenosylmethionine decarboxylase
MPGMEPAGRYAELRRQEASSPKVLYAVDALAAADSAVHDLTALTQAAMNAVSAGAGHVLESAHVVFPNGAITLVLVLAESHLSVHTWPEESLVAIDLFSCGAIDGDAVIADLVRALGLASARTRELPRGI